MDKYKNAIGVIKACGLNVAFGKELMQQARQIENTIVLALEKQIPKKPRETRCALMCANCGHKITAKGCVKTNLFYCKVCGQAILWESEVQGE